MKKTILKFTVGFLALAIGIAIVWASGVFQVLFPQPANSSLPVAKVPATRQPAREKSGKVLIIFKEFEYRKGWVANFEIINDTTQLIFYVGSKGKYESDYCTLAVKRNEKVENLTFRVRSRCYYSTGMFLQTLEPSESVVLTVWEHEARDMLFIKDSKLETKAQIGLEFFVGEEKRREMLWSEEITFPYDEYR